MTAGIMPRRMGRRLLAAACGAMLLLGSGPAAAAPPGGPAAAPASGAAATEVRYRAPVDGPLSVLRGFDEVGRYDAGHRGVDIAIAPGSVVLAASAGEVTFAGLVAGRGVVVVLHPDGIRTSYEPVAGIVAAGQRVDAGEPIGVVSGAHGAFHADTALHWGARRGEAYVDPMRLLRRLGQVRLVA